MITRKRNLIIEQERLLIKKYERQLFTKREIIYEAREIMYYERDIYYFLKREIIYDYERAKFNYEVKEIID
jgi:hypothetical protein